MIHPVPKPAKSKTRKVLLARPEMSESELQNLCEEYLQMLGIRYIRIPDQVYGSLFSSATFRARGLMAAYLKGLPDLTMLFESGKYVCVELKTTCGNLRQGQKHWSSGYVGKFYHVIRTFEEFIELVKRHHHGS